MDYQYDGGVLSRRQWMINSSACLLAASQFGLAPVNDSKRPRVAAILTEFAFRSHAHVILENFLEPYYFNGKLTDPGAEIVSLYVDQFPEGRDMARSVARQYGIPIFDSIRDAMTLKTSRLAVDAILSIGEHGRYPRTSRGAVMYPRKRFFDEIVHEFRNSGSAVPVFNDKHLSYRQDWADEMMAVARELKIPFMAGSSVPLAERRPPLEIASGTKFTEAVSIHGGPPESYDFHAMEVLQSLVEGRAGGESGVRSIQMLEEDEVWKAAAAGRWDSRLAKAALSNELGRQVDSLENFTEPRNGQKFPVHAILIEYRDGFRATILSMGRDSTRWLFAARIADQPDPVVTRFYVGPWENRNLFKALSHAIQVHFRERTAPYPVERTWLVTGMLEAALQSRFEKNRLVETPHLNIKYRARDFRRFREMGASWKVITEDQPEPTGINPGGPRPT